MAGETSAIRAGAAYVELFLKDNRLRAGLVRAAARLKAFGAMVTGIGLKIAGMGAVVFAPLAIFAKQATDAGGALVDMSGRTGMSVESLSELGYAASQTGTDLATFEGGVRKMQKTIADAAGGSESAAESLAAIGLSAAELQGLSTDEQFARIAKAVAAIPDPGRRAAAAMDVLGKSGTALLPMIGQLDALVARARELDVVITGVEAQALDDLGDKIADLAVEWNAAKVKVFATFAPAMTEIVEVILRAVKAATDWTKENPQLVAGIVAVAAAAIAGGGALISFGLALSTIGFVLGGIATGISVVAGVVGFIGTALAALLSPLGLVTLGVAGLVAGLVFMSDTWQGVGADLATGFGELKTDALSTFGAIKDAMSAGDFKLAAKILWTFLKLEWTRGIGYLHAKWIEFKSFFQRVWAEAVFSAASIITNAWAGLQETWVKITSFMSEAWIDFTSGLTKGWQIAQNFIAKGVLKLMKLFDDSIDEDQARGILDQQLTDDTAEAERKRLAQLRETDESKKKSIANIETERQGTLDVLEDDRQRRQDEIGRNQNAEVAALEAELAQLKAELAAGVKAAATVAADDGREKLGGAEKAVAEAGATIGGKASEGTFSAAAASRLGGGNRVLDRIGKATEETAKNTRKIGDKKNANPLLVGNA